MRKSLLLLNMAEIKRISPLVPLTSVIIVQAKGENPMSAGKVFAYVFVVVFLFTAVVILAVMPFVLKPLLQTQVVVTATVTPTEFGAHPRVLSRATITVTPTVTIAPTAMPTPAPTATRRPIPTPRVEDGQLLVICEGHIVTDQLNLREGPNANYRIIRGLGRGVRFMAFARNLDGTWIKVTVEDGTTGWLNGSFVSLTGCTVWDLVDPAP